MSEWAQNLPLEVRDQESAVGDMKPMDVRTTFAKEPKPITAPPFIASGNQPSGWTNPGW